MLRKWSARAAIALGTIVGLFLLVAVVLQVPAVGQTIGSPKACGTCHVMTYEVVTLEHSAHHNLACLDCHAATGFVEKPVEEFKSATRHLYIFITDKTPDVIHPLEESRKIVQENCVRCHTSTLGDTHLATQKEAERYCFECHRETPHGTPLRN